MRPEFPHIAAFSQDMPKLGLRAAPYFTGDPNTVLLKRPAILTPHIR